MASTLGGDLVTKVSDALGLKQVLAVSMDMVPNEYVTVTFAAARKAG